MTPAEPDQGVPSTTRARLKAAALGVVGALLVPLPAAAAPAPCEQALRYAAQSGTQLMRIGTLDLGPAGRNDKPITDVGVGDAKSALVAQSPINAAALGRVLDGGPANRKALAAVLQQTAPPTNKKPKSWEHEATDVGPFRLGASELSVHAQWDPAMACGNAAGEATRAAAELRRAGVLEDGDAALVRVPGKISGLSTTAMERRGPAARAVAAASMAAGKIKLLGGAVEIEVVRPPSLLATMSGTDGGEVRYKPAVIEVSGEGFEITRLDTAGDSVELRLDENGDPAADQDGLAKGGTGQDRARKGRAARDGAGQVGGGRAGSGKDDAAADNAGQDGAARTDARQDGTAHTGAGQNGAGAHTDAGHDGGAQNGAGRTGAGHDGAARTGVAQSATAGTGTARTGANNGDAGEDGDTKASALRGGAAKSAVHPGAAKQHAVQGDMEEVGGDNAGRAAAGQVDKRVHPGGSVAESASKDNVRKPGQPASNRDNAARGGPFAGLPGIGALTSGTPLPVPSLPGVPPLADPGTERGPETAPATGPGTTVKISLGDVRQAVSGHAIGAKATAMTIAITKSPQRYADSATNRSGPVLDFDMGLLEVAAVAPEPAGGVSSMVGGAAGGLPITGPRVDVVALTGVALLIAGAAALIFGMRGRSRP